MAPFRLTFLFRSVSHSVIFDGRGLYKSTDGGATWSLNDVFGAHTHFSAVRVSPHNPSIVYAAVYLDQTGRTVFYQSTNEGATWTQKSGTPPQGQGWYDLMCL